MPWNSCVMGFLTLIVLTCSSSAGRASRLIVLAGGKLYPCEALERDHVPFFWGYDLDDSGLHPIHVNLFYKLWKAAKLFQSLRKSITPQ